MSVLIKGMEMPTSCRECSLYLQSMDSERNVYENCAVTGKSYNWGITTRPSDCPLVDVVHCKDCVRHTDEELGMVYCPHIVGGWCDDDWYCNSGVRRKKETE